MVSKKNSSKTSSGSPIHGEPAYLSVGYLRRAHGVRGEMVMEVITDFPERLKARTKVFVGEDFQPMKIASVRHHHEGLLIKFEGLDRPEDTARFRNQVVYVSVKDRPPLPEGQFYIHELIGFDVMDDEGRLVGKLNDIIQTGANDVYVVVTPEEKEILLPVIPSVVLELDADRRLIRVHLMDGL